MLTTRPPGRVFRIVALVICGLVLSLIAAYVVFVAVVTWILSSLTW